MSGIRCVRWGRHTKCAGLGVLQDRFENPWNRYIKIKQKNNNDKRVTQTWKHTHTHTHTTHTHKLPPIPNCDQHCDSEQVWLTVIHNHIDTHMYLMCSTYSPTHAHSHSLALLYQDSARTILIKYSYNRFALLIIKQACCVSVYRSICKGTQISLLCLSLTHTMYLAHHNHNATEAATDRTMMKWTYTSFYLHPYLCHHLSEVSLSLSLQSISLSYSSDKWLAVGDNHRSLNTSNICRAVLQSLTTRDIKHTRSPLHTHTHSPQSCWIPPNRVRVGRVFALCICRCDFKDGLDKEVGKMRANTHTQSERCLLINSNSFLALTHKSRIHKCWKCSVIKSKLNSLVCVLCDKPSPW